MNDETLGERAHAGRLSPSAIAAGALLLVAAVCGLWSVVAFHRSSAAIDRSKETVVRLERVLSSVKALETSQRGFLLTGADAYLAPYR